MLLYVDAKIFLNLIRVWPPFAQFKYRIVGYLTSIMQFWHLSNKLRVFASFAAIILHTNSKNSTNEQPCYVQFK